MIFQSMRSKMLLIITLVTVSVAMLLTIIFYWKSSSMIEENFAENQYARIRQMGDAFDTALAEGYYQAVQAACDEQIAAQIEKYRNTKNELDLTDLAASLRDYAGRHRDFSSVYLVIPDKRIIVSSKDYPVYEKNAAAEKIKEIETAGRKSMIPKAMKDPLQETSKILTFVSPVEDAQGEKIAYIMNNMEERSLFYEYLDSLEDHISSNAVLIDDAGIIVSARDSQRADESCNKWQEGINGVSEDKNQEMIIITYQTSFAGWYLQMETERNEVLADLKEIRFFLGFIILAAFGVSIIPVVLITKAMYQPLADLTNAMKSVSEGELEKRVKVTAKDEIGILSKNFNGMLDHIQELIRQLIQEEMLKKDAELDALQYQITPHFMYNTLNSIKYAAFLKGEKEIGQLIEDFAELLQASIQKKGVFVTAAEELNLVEKYMNLQNMRFEEKIQVRMEVHAEAEGCFLPRLMLQPLVENAILHGMDLKSRHNEIRIGGHIENGMLCLWVQDNGRGMSKEQIEKLLTKKARKTRGLSGIGVANVKERLQLYYGEKGSIWYESIAEGTKASIQLPAYKEQDRYALQHTVFDSCPPFKNGKELEYDQDDNCGR